MKRFLMSIVTATSLVSTASICLASSGYLNNTEHKPYSSFFSQIEVKAYNSIKQGNARKFHPKGKSWKHYEDAITILKDQNDLKYLKLKSKALIGMGNATHQDHYFVEAMNLGRKIELTDSNYGRIVVAESLCGLGDNKNSDNDWNWDAFHYIEAINIISKLDTTNTKVNNMKNRIYLGLGNTGYTDKDHCHYSTWFLEVLEDPFASQYHKQRAEYGLKSYLSISDVNNIKQDIAELL